MTKKVQFFPVSCYNSRESKNDAGSQFPMTNNTPISHTKILGED